MTSMEKAILKKYPHMTGKHSPSSLVTDDITLDRDGEFFTCRYEYGRYVFHITMKEFAEAHYETSD